MRYEYDDRLSKVWFKRVTTVGGNTEGMYCYGNCCWGKGELELVTAPSRRLVLPIVTDN